MTPGAFLYNLRKRLRGGPHTAWHREMFRGRIRNARPIPGTSDRSVAEVHLLTSAEDWLNACWAAWSFYSVTGRAWALVVHDDGTLPDEAHQTLRRLFPDGQLLDRSSADRALEPVLASYPNCTSFRQTNKLSLKVFDVLHYSSAPRLLLLDSDILFFRSPAALLERFNDPLFLRNAANSDVASAYTVEPGLVEERCGFRPIERFNSGLCLLHRDSLRLDWFEEFLSLPGILSHPWRIEQTLLALASSRFGTELLPDEYTVRLGPGVGERPCKHYIGAIRDLMYTEGMPLVVRTLDGLGD